MQKYTRNTLSKLNIPLQKPTIIFLYGDLWAGKTTLSKHIITDRLGILGEVTSPTYTYYNKIQDVYHFDLYRLSTYEEFIHIWGEEILDNNTGVVIVEWPELIESYYTPDIAIHIHKTAIEGEREIEVKLY